MATAVAIVDFWSEWCQLLLTDKSPKYSLPSFQPIGLLVQENKFKIDLQDSSHLRVLIETILAFFFNLQVTPILPTKFRVRWTFRPGEVVQNTFLKWPPWPASWISDQKDLAIFDLQVTAILPTF